ncbi:IKI3 family-domain-containing protein [Chytriomyces sp. MP71]|nr:IKI3 family-domain-containing protein [Chytriomyces sp. MP71]
MRSLVSALLAVVRSRAAADDGDNGDNDDNDPRPLLAVDADSRTVHLVRTTARDGAIAASVVASPSPPRDPVPVFGDAPDSRPVAAHFAVESASLVVALSHGEIVALDINAQIQKQEVVGSIDDGIREMKWAPDGEVGVFVSGAGTLLVMTQNWDLVGEASLFDRHAHSHEQFVSVGWGKKETQFHGSAGKLAALEKQTDASNSLTPYDDFAPRISWRADASLFAVSFVDPVTARRVIHTYTRECAHHSTSEPVPFLHHPLSWRPQGNLMATVQTLPSRQLQVSFFETNGLRHGEFALREHADNAHVRELAWNADGSVLAVLLHRHSSSLKEEEVVVQLWTMGNYYWYLKREVRAAMDGDFVDTLLWDPEDAMKLHIACGRGKTLETHTFASLVQTSTSGSPSTSQPVIVTDGTHLLVTPFRTSNMPPPMAEFKLGPFSACVESVAVGEADRVAVLLSDGTMVVTEAKEGATLRTIRHTRPVGSVYRQITFAGPATLMALETSVDETRADAVVYFDLDLSATEGKVNVLAAGRVADLPDAARGLLRLHADLRSGVVLLESSGGVVSRLEELETGVWVADEVVTLPATCPWIAPVMVEDGEVSVLGLSDRNRLYVGERLVSSEVTSFCVHDDHVILTTLSHTARFMPLAVENEDALIIPATGTMLHDETLRRVERGSRIVAAVPGDMKLILQMPRGNLETIYPRALVLSSIRSALDRLDYKTAFALCRKHRINMNLLVDHDPRKFMVNVGLFVTAVQDADYLNVFVSSLSETDVTKTMYVPVPAPPATPAYFAAGTKVSTICTAVREALAPLDKVTYITTVLTTFAKPTPQELESAMSTVKSMKAISLEETENALKYLIFLADSDRLYDVALGMYDFQLVVMVAQFSQKDPREYLPFLTALKLLTKNRQYYRIDDHLGRYAGAMGHLCALIAELDASGQTEESTKVFREEFIPYILKHELFKLALEKYEDHPDRLRGVLEAHGSFLFSKAKFAESGLMLYMAGEKARALLSYRSDYALWKQALSVAQEMGLSKPEVLELANELTEMLMERHEYRDASTVYLEYMGNVLGGVRALLKGSFWEEAVRVAQNHGRGDLVSSDIKSAVHAEYETALEDLTDLVTTFHKQRLRLDIVRKEHLERQAKIDSGEYDPLLDSIDMMSDTTSMASSKKTARTGKTSLSSGVTAKSRRRQDRKRAAGKEGTFYEEEFLVNSLYKAVEKSNALRGSIYRLVTALMTHGFIKEARTLQSTYTSMLPVLEKGCVGVFEPENIATKGSGGKTVEEEKVAYMVSVGAMPSSAVPAGAAPTLTANDAEVVRKRDPTYPAAPPAFSSDTYGLDVL